MLLPLKEEKARITAISRGRQENFSRGEKRNTIPSQGGVLRDRRMWCKRMIGKGGCRNPTNDQLWKK